MEKKSNTYFFFSNMLNTKHRFLSIKLISFYHKLQYRNRNSLMCVDQI